MFTPEDAIKDAEAKADEMLPGIYAALKANHKLEISGNEPGMNREIIDALIAKLESAGWKCSRNLLGNGFDVSMPSTGVAAADTNPDDNRFTDALKILVGIKKP